MQVGVIMLNDFGPFSTQWSCDVKKRRRKSGEKLGRVTAIQVITASATASRKNMRKRTLAGSPVTRDKGVKATAKVTAAAGEKERVRPVPSENRVLLEVARSGITRLPARLSSGREIAKLTVASQVSGQSAAGFYNRAYWRRQRQSANIASPAHCLVRLNAG